MLTEKVFKAMAGYTERRVDIREMKQDADQFYMKQTLRKMISVARWNAGLKEEQADENSRVRVMIKGFKGLKNYVKWKKGKRFLFN